ncbi:MAG: hypothetical protein M1820_007956 [Bogoriella megaspora]|nr:MAG: hypothetical protein M1820_007956 [Bogoriella megaspora]
MTVHEKEFGFSESDFDWERYARVRPKYPQHLWNHILDHHRKHGNGKFEVAHDIGSGFGIVAENLLLPNFGHVFVSDPVSHNLDAAKFRLNKRSNKGKVKFHEAGAEDGSWLPSGQIDMVTAFECLHWSDSTKSMPAIASQLRSGGTFAALYYSPRPLIRNNRRADKAWTSIFEKFAQCCYESNHTTVDFMAQCYDGLDGIVRLSTDKFKPGVLRQTINQPLLEESPYGGARNPFQIGPRHSRGRFTTQVGPEDHVETIVDEDNWSQQVDAEWLKDFVKSLQPKLPLDRVVEEFKELDKAIEEEGGKTRAAWIVQITLATRR